MKLDLNCDLGEGEPLSRTRALMREITSANIACGGHAGDLRTMKSCLHLARKCSVRVGAHPGHPDRAGFGRSRAPLSSDEFELLLLQQAGALDRLARDAGMRLHHIKLHGALYHLSERDPAICRRYLQTVARCWPRARIYALAGGRVARAAQRVGVPVWEEAFADRAYRDDGSLLPRDRPGAIVEDSNQVVARVQRLLKDGQVEAVRGKLLPLRPRTLCLHADTRGSVKLARLLRRHLQEG